MLHMVQYFLSYFYIPGAKTRGLLLRRRPRFLPPAPPSIPAVQAAPQTEEELTEINRILRVKSVLECLKKSDRPLSTEDIRIRSQVDLDQDVALAAKIRTNPRVVYHELSDSFSYRPKYEANNASQLLQCIQREWKRTETEPGDGRRYGIPVKGGELLDSYKGCEQDLEKLHAQQQIYLIWSRVELCLVAFPRDLQYPLHPLECQLDADMQTLTTECLKATLDSESVANSTAATHPHAAFSTGIWDLEEQLRRAGLMPAPRLGARPVQRRRAPQRRRGRAKTHAPVIMGNPEPEEPEGEGEG